MPSFRLWRGLAIPAALILFGPPPSPAATAAPSVQSVTDSAGYAPRVAPGSLASIFGTNLAGSEASAPGFPLPTNLGGTSVVIGGVTAPLLYVNTGQINFQVPASAKTGTVALTVQGPGGTSASFNVTVTSSSPAIFQYGSNHAVAQNSGTLNSSSSPAASGSVVTVYLTGIGAVDNAVADGSPAPNTPLSNATAGFSATIGPQSATVQFLGLTPGFAGLAQANILVPALPTGDYPFILTVGGYVSASAVISVSGSGTPYTSPLQLTGSAQFVNTANSTIALYNNVAYVCGLNHIVMVDVTSPANPSVIGTFGDGIFNGNGNFCAINTAAATPFLVEVIGTPTSPESFAVYALSNPRSPNLLTVATTPYPQIVAMSFAGNYAYVTTSYITYYTSGRAIAAQNGDFLVFDFTNPAGPLYLGSLQPATANLKPDLESINQVYAYVAGSTATGTSTNGSGMLSVINAATPSNPFLLNQVTVSQAAILLSFDISGNTLLAAGNTAGQRNPGVPDFAFTGNVTLTTMSLANVQAPGVVATFTTMLQANGTFYVSAFPNGVFAVVNNPPATDTFGPASLMIVDARQPATILPYEVQTQFGFAGIVATTGNYLLAPTLFGLNIYQLQL